MENARRTLVLALAALAWSVTSLNAQPAASPSRVSLTPEQTERFLLTAKMVSLRPAAKGVTNTRIGTFTDGQVTHDVHIQAVDVAYPVFETWRGTELNFKDSYRYNIAAYRLSVLLGLDNVPMSVRRDFQGMPAAYTWFLDDVMFDEGDRIKRKATDPDPQRWARQVHIQRVFDELIQNVDRNAGNTLWTTDWKMWLIDHTRAFRLGTSLRRPKLLERIERTLLARIRGLTAANVQAAVGESLTSPEVEAVVARAGVLVAFFDKKIAELGEARVLYTWR